MIQVIALAHGTNHPDGRAANSLIREQLQGLLNEKAAGTYTVHEAYLDLQEPSIGSVAAQFAAGDQVVILPLMLATDMHAQLDWSDILKNSTARFRVARALGPSAELARLQRQRLEEAGWAARDELVMAAEGACSSESSYLLQEQSAILSNLLREEITYGYITGAKPTITEEIEKYQPDIVVSFLLTPGQWQSELVKLAGAGESPKVTQPLVLPGDIESARLVAKKGLEHLEEATANYINFS